MAEVYPMRSPGEYAGSLCGINRCKNYAQFAIQPFNNGIHRAKVSCGHHVSVMIKGLWLEHGKAVVIQEIPGNWFQSGQTLVEHNGEIVHVHAEKNRR